jgi:aminoglycoside 6'-N-acetyltransferase
VPPAGAEDAQLRGERLALRPARSEDADALAAILAEPAVAAWWGSFDGPDDVRAELPGSFVIVVDDRLAGWLLVEEDTDDDYRHVAFDIALATAFQGRGYGREALRVAIRYFVERGHHRFTMDPAAHNARAIRAYAAIGFRPVGIMREYARGRDGTWHDGLLMDLLARELA